MSFGDCCSPCCDGKIRRCLNCGLEQEVSTMWCHKNTIYFLQNPHKRHHDKIFGKAFWTDIWLRHYILFKTRLIGMSPGTCSFFFNMMVQMLGWDYFHICDVVIIWWVLFWSCPHFVLFCMVTVYRYHDTDILFHYCSLGLLDFVVWPQWASICIKEEHGQDINNTRWQNKLKLIHCRE